MKYEQFLRATFPLFLCIITVHFWLGWGGYEILHIILIYPSENAFSKPFEWFDLLLSYHVRPRLSLCKFLHCQKSTIDLCTWTQFHWWNLFMKTKAKQQKHFFKLTLGFNLIICLKKRKKVWWNNSNSVSLKHPRNVECAPQPLLVPCPPAAHQMCLPNPQTLICIQSIQEVILLMELLFLQLPFWGGV